MCPQLEPVQSDTVLPKEVDVAVIGGGIIGCAAALYLRRAGTASPYSRRAASAASNRAGNWGWCRQQGRDLAELALATRSLPASAEPARVRQADQSRVRLRQPGVLFVTKSSTELESWARWQAAAREQQVLSTLLGPSEARCQDARNR